MQDFCPFDFEKIDWRNLAYELTYADPWNKDAVKKRTVVGEEKPFYISENDTRRAERYKDVMSGERVILLANDTRGGKSGLQMFKELIRRKNSQSEQTRDGKIRIRCSEEPNGIHTFYDAAKRTPIMYAIPCCPYCHNRLPIGWNTAEDFIAISLVGPTGSGKTTYEYSLMGNEWAALQNLGTLNGKRLTFSSAQLADDPVCRQLSEAAARMCRDYGECPENTDRKHAIPPVFLNAEYNGHLLTVGVYDNAGENLEHLDVMSNPNLKMLLNKMYADIYLFDPEHMDLDIRRNEPRMNFGEYRILDPVEQGMYQAGNPDLVIHAKDLLATLTRPVLPGRQTDILKVYNKNRTERAKFNTLSHMKHMFFSGVIIKSDLLREIPEIAQNPVYEYLLRERYSREIMTIDEMADRTARVVEMIDEFHMLGDKNLDDFSQEYGRGASWYCVSSLGCDAEMAGKLKGQYRPVRIAEPLIDCIINRIGDTDWIG